MPGFCIENGGFVGSYTFNDFASVNDIAITSIFTFEVALGMIAHGIDHFEDKIAHFEYKDRDFECRIHHVFQVS